MVSNSGNEIVLFYASERLVGQVARWLQGNRSSQLHLTETRGPVEMETAMRKASTVIVDATGDPERALDAVEVAIDAVGRQRVAVYCESTDSDIEVVARMHAVTILSGPLGPMEWSQAMDTLRRASQPQPAV